MEIDRIREFLDYQKSTKVTRKELEELGNLERALDRTWKYARRLATSEDLDALAEPDDSKSKLGTAVGDTLRDSRRFLREATMAKLNNQGNHDGLGPISRDTSIATPAIVEGEVEASVTLLAPLEGDEQRSTSTHAQTLKEATRISAGKAKHQVKLHPEGMRMLTTRRPTTTYMTWAGARQ